MFMALSCFHFDIGSELHRFGIIKKRSINLSSMYILLTVSTYGDADHAKYQNKFISTKSTHYPKKIFRLLNIFQTNVLCYISASLGRFTAEGAP